MTLEAKATDDEGARKMLRLGYAAIGLLALGLGVAGIFLPLLPTVPFVLLAAFCFARSNARWERRLLDHPVFGPHIRNWRSNGAISRRGKAAAAIAFAASAAIGLVFLDLPWALVPLLAALIGGSWVLTRPDS
jgi:uncharacterized membrane protein YbaN (DUF454 family)